MSLKQEGREGIRTAEWGEGNNYLALPSPPTREEGISLPFHLINGKLCSPERSWSLGGWGGRKRLGLSKLSRLAGKNKLRLPYASKRG